MSEDLIKQLKEVTDNLAEKIKVIHLSELEKILLKTFKEVLKKARDSKEWYSKGKCYKCGGVARINNTDQLDSSSRCLTCNTELFTDAYYQYYYEDIIKYLLEVIEDNEEWVNSE